MFTILGIFGLLIISAAIWQKSERKQDFLFILGGSAMLVYSISIGSLIFVILQTVFILSSLSELLKLSKKYRK